MRRADYSKYTAVLILLSFYFQSCRPYPYVEGVTYYPSIRADTLNKYDKHKHRTGYWIECVDNNLIPVTNKSAAVFYRYDYYSKNMMVLPAMWAGKNGTVKFLDSYCSTKKDTAVALNGKYQVFDEKGRLLGESYYNKGVFMYYKRYSKNGQLVEEYISSEKSNYPFAFSYKTYSKTGEVSSNLYFYSENGKSHCVDSNELVHIKK